MNNETFNKLINEAKNIGLKTTVVLHNNVKQILRNNPISITYLINLSNQLDSLKIGDVVDILDKKYFIKKELLKGICPYQNNNSYEVIQQLFYKDKEKEQEVLERIMMINMLIKKILAPA